MRLRATSFSIVAMLLFGASAKGLMAQAPGKGFSVSPSASAPATDGKVWG